MAAKVDGHGYGSECAVCVSVEVDVPGAVLS